jgi:tetratricopeptide (TPR) repeat protein
MSLVSFIENPDSSKKAIELLDSATKIDSNYFLGHYNKLMFLSQLNRNDESLRTLKRLIVLRPNAHDLYLMGGIWHEKIGNSDSSHKYFEKSLSICNSVLDTMNKKNKDYVMLMQNKAINLIMLDDSLKANILLKNLIDFMPDDPKFGNVEKEYIHSLMGKSKIEMLNSFSARK